MIENLDSMPNAGSAAERYERLKRARDLVRRTALLLSTDLPLHDLFGQLAALLAVFVDASGVMIAIGDESEARVEYTFEDGVGGRPENPHIGPATVTGCVLRSGEPVLLRRVEDWPETTTRGDTVSGIFVPIPFGGRAVGVLSVQSRLPEAYDDDDVAMLEGCAIYLGVRLHDEEQRAERAGLEAIATTDALTGLPNRRSFDETLLHEWRRCARSGGNLALAMIDVDYFKKFNDAYGHVAGDGCLRQIAQAMGTCLKRPGDFLARYGGEEFALILPESDAAGAVQLAESVCAAVRGIAISHQGSSLGYTTLSIGVAARVPDADADPQTLLAAADAMLYEAKEGGRNRVAADGHRTDAPVAQARAILRHNLPRYLTETIGRERDVAEVVALLRASPMVSIIGPGGVGKTRLATQVAQQLLDDYGDGVWFVDLAPLDDPMLVTSAIAAVFDVADAGGQPLIDGVGAALRAKQLLIVLDNCEHLISAVADAAGRLEQLCRQVRILATSREPLGVAGEQSYRMPTLPLPPAGREVTAERAMEYASVALFVARAHAAQHTFTLTDENAPIVADIVRRLDGIALAIELAASRVKVLSVAQLDQRLDERFKLLIGGSRAAPSRQKTLHALIGWSYDLLSEPERSVLRQIGNFRGDWSLEAAEGICIDERFPEWDVLDILGSLVDKSLVAVESAGDEPRYRLLESTRQFAAERLTEAGERKNVAARHGRYFAEVAHRADDAFWQTDMDEWIAQVRIELENHRAAIAWGLGDDGDATVAATIVGSLRCLWWSTASREGRMLLERTVARLSAAAPALPSAIATRVHALLVLTEAAFHSGGTATAAEAARLWRGGDVLKSAEALSRYADALGTAGRLAESVASFEEAQAAARVTRAPRLIGTVLSTAAYWIGAAGDGARAGALFDEATVLLRACGDRKWLANLQVNRAELLFAQGEVLEAVAAQREAEALYRERSDEGILTVVLMNVAAYLLALGRNGEAWTAVREGLDLASRVDVDMQTAIGIGHLAHLAAEIADPVQSARLLGYVDSVYQRNGAAREPTEQRGYNRARELIRAALPEDRIAPLLVAGATLNQEVACAEAMSIPQPPIT